MNAEFLQRQGSGSEESSSLSEPDLFRNVKSLPESTSSAGMLQCTIALTFIILTCQQLDHKLKIIAIITFY